MNQILSATVIRQNNFPVGTKLTGYRRLALSGCTEEFVVTRASEAPFSGNAVERMDCIEVANPHAVRVGDIFEMSWGYDQTNVNYFQVTRLSAGGCFVREIGAKSVPGTQGFMSETVTPAPGKFLDRSQWCSGSQKQRAAAAAAGTHTGNVETFRKVHYDGKGGASFNFSGRYYASRVSANSTTYNSWYA